MWLLSKLGSKFYGYLAGIALALAIFWKVLAMGGDKEKRKNLEKSLKRIERGDQIEDDVRTTSDDDVDARLFENDWIDK